ncbi:hypothetical protein [Immundisolibacter sp.]
MIVILNKPSLIHLSDELMLKSGANTVDANVFKKYKDNPSVKQLVADGVIEYKESDLEGKTQSKVEDSLKDLTVKQAQELVQNTIDLEILEKWKGAEKRAGVLKAIEKQIAELQAPAKLRTDGDSSEELEGDESEDSESEEKE